jgi:anti-anti-sigma regulatory factor
MSQKFQASIQNRGDVSFVKLGGVIDEDNDLTTLVDRIPTGTAVIDLGEIERINSCGVRDWVNWLSKLEHNGTRSVLVECSPAIVAQINLVNNFTGSGVVKSFYVPYFCSECDEEKVLLVEAADMGPPPHEPPTCRCDECDLVMDFDDMPDSYFAFLSNQRKVADGKPASAGQLEAADSTSSASGPKVRPRSSGANLSAPGSGQSSGHSGKMSVPSLSSVQRASPQASATGSGPLGMKLANRSGITPQPGGSRPPGSLGSRLTSGQHARISQPGISSNSPPQRSNTIVFVLIGLLAAALAVLAYLVLAK